MWNKYSIMSYRCNKWKLSLHHRSSPPILQKLQNLLQHMTPFSFCYWVPHSSSSWTRSCFHQTTSRCLCKDRSRCFDLRVSAPSPSGSRPGSSHWPGRCDVLCSNAEPQSSSLWCWWGQTSHLDLTLDQFGTLLKQDESNANRCKDADASTTLLLECVANFTFDIKADGFNVGGTRNIVPGSIIIYPSTALSSTIIVWFSRIPVSERCLILLVEVWVWHRPPPAVHVIVQSNPG